MSKTTTKSKRSKKSKKAKKGSILAFVRTMFERRPKLRSSKGTSFDQLPQDDRLNFPHEGKGRYRIYVERAGVGGKDYYFPTVKQAADFYNKTKIESHREDSDIWKIRTSGNMERSNLLINDDLSFG